MSVPNAARESFSACEFVRKREVIAAAVVDRQFAAFPDLYARYGEAGRDKCLADARYHILYLAEAVTARSPVLLHNYVSWLKGLLLGLGISTDDLANQFKLLAVVLKEFDSSPDGEIAVEYLRNTLDEMAGMPSEPESHLRGDNDWSTLATDLLDDLVSCRRIRAFQRVNDAVEKGIALEALYLEVFQPLLREVGRLWQMNRLSVAQEHYCTAAVQLAMGQLSAKIFSSRRVGHTVVTACVGDELHEIGLRMVTDMFEMAGWDSHFLGANLPTRDLLDMLASTNAELLCLSATLTTHLPVARYTIQQVRAQPALKGVKIVVGGYPFNVQNGLWKHLNADGCARDARAAVELGSQLVMG